MPIRLRMDFFNFYADGRAGLIDRKAPGKPSGLRDKHRAALADIFNAGPSSTADGVVRWRVIDFCQVWPP